MRQLWILLSCCALSFAAEAQTTTATYVKPGFPRLAVVYVGGTQNEDQLAVQQQIARGSIALIGTWPGWAGSCNCMTLEQAVKAIKAINPSELIVQYLKNDEEDSGTPAIYNKLNVMHWWLYPSGTSGTPVPASYAGQTSTNNTTLTQKDSSGNNWVTWYANYAYNTYAVPTPSLDGFFTDNVFVTPNVSGDWSLSGKSEPPDATSAQWVQEGYRLHFATLNQLMPGKFQIGNVAAWGGASTNLSLYNGMLPGGLMEALLGPSWAIESWAGWKGMMNAVNKTMAALSQPQLGIFHQLDNPTNYQSFRYGLTSAMMTDAYYAFSQLNSDGSANYSYNPWFDEYAWQGKLGQATTSAPTAAWQNGVWRRDFQGGIALVNPKGNGTQTVTLESAYTRLSSTCPTCQNQAPAVNSGQPVTTLTLQDRDGIILLRNGSQQTVPDAPTLTVN